MLRFATPDDAGALLSVYAQYIDTAVTFEYALPTEAEFRRRIEDTLEGYPYLVYEQNGAVLGYAYAHRHMVRAAYQWNAELSIYLDKSARRRGLGRNMISALIDILRLQGIRNVYGCVTLPNDSSTGLQEALGFSRCCLYHNAGYKNGRWRDVAWYEKAIAGYDDDPAPPRSVNDIPPADIRAILAAYDI